MALWLYGFMALWLYGSAILSRLPFLQGKSITLQCIMITIENAGIATALTAIFELRLYRRCRWLVVVGQCGHGREKEKRRTIINYKVAGRHCCWSMRRPWYLN